MICCLLLSVKETMMRLRLAPVKPLLIILSLMLATLPTLSQGKATNDARAAVQSFFELLKAKNYAELYDYLPTEMRQRIPREQLAQGLKRLDDFLVIEKMEIGRVQQRRISGSDYAVIETTLYGRLRRPMETNGQKLEAGKVIVQQYLFKEGQQWKIATADGNTRARFLKLHPEFDKSFQLKQPRFFIKQNGAWKAFGRGQ